MNEMSRARLMKELTAPAWEGVATFCLIGVSDHGMPILINTSRKTVPHLLGAIEIAKSDVLDFVKKEQNKDAPANV